MQFSPAHHKWLKRLTIFLVCFSLLAGTVYYLFSYKLKDVMQVFVKRQSNGLYSFDAGSINISLSQKKIIVRDISIICNDTVHAASHSTIKISEIYLSITSFTDLLFHKKISVDSIAVVSPQIVLHGHTQQASTKHVSFEISKVVDMLQKTLTHLQLHAFKIIDGSFTYSNLKTAAPFESNHINFSISNFGKKDSLKNYLFATDDIDLSITDQYWKMPDGLHEIGFKKLHFSGVNQYFELDSCVIYSIGDEKQSNISLSADRLFFNSKQLQNLYEKEELIVDTIVCDRPVLNLQTAAKTQIDTTEAIANATHHFLKKMNFKYIHVNEGQFLLNSKNKALSTYATQKTNLEVFNLDINPDHKPALTLDSIKLKLSAIEFVTKDSLYKLSIREFALNENDLILKDARYGPTIMNHNQGALVFSTPVMHLKDINLEDLMQKKLKGSAAEIFKPRIILFDKGKSKIETGSSKAQGMENFYKTLHELSDLIDVDSFRIIDGSMHYSASKNPVTLEMKTINSIILINRFLRSDSLIDIKRSIPILNIKTIDVRSPAMRLVVDNFNFNGTFRHNSIDQLQISLENKSVITAKKLYWEIFDWDIFKNTKVIQVENFNIQEVTADIKSPQKETQKKAVKNLPQLRVSRFDIGQLNMTMQTKTPANIKLNAHDICLDQIGSQQQFLTWDNLMAQINMMSFDNQQVAGNIKKISIDNSYENVFQGISFDINNNKQRTKINAPSLNAKIDFHSSDFSKLQINSVAIDKPIIDIYLRGNKSGQDNIKALSMPANFKTDEFKINSAIINYRNEKDSMDISAKLSMEIKSLTMHKQGDDLLGYENAAFDIANLELKKKNIHLQLPASSIVLNNGELKKTEKNNFLIKSGVLWNWDDLSLIMNRRDSSTIAVEKFSGAYKDAGFEFEKGNKINWKKLISHASVKDGMLAFHNKNFNASATNLRWNGSSQSFHSGDFFMTPTRSVEDAFAKAKWQADYMTIKGKSIDLHGVQFNQQPNDSTFEIKKIIVNQVAINTTRDKRMPFQHGIEKLMPTGLLNSIKFPFHIDSLFLQESAVTVNEISAITKKEGMIPLEELNAVITNIKNRPTENDSLYIGASAKLLNNYIDHVQYKESYADSLSSFTLQFHASPMILTTFNPATAPLAAVRVNSGNSDTLYANWVGNKYAAIGKMNFRYNGLSVQLLDKDEPAKKKFLLSIENFLANSIILHKNNTKESIVFFERDREKFVFNYWVKTSLSGLLSSIGIKGNKKYYKKYTSVKSTYSLPVVPR